jgi:hypothetical protein
LSKKFKRVLPQAISFQVLVRLEIPHEFLLFSHAEAQRRRGAEAQRNQPVYLRINPRFFSASLRLCVSSLFLFGCGCAAPSIPWLISGFIFHVTFHQSGVD